MCISYRAIRSAAARAYACSRTQLNIMPARSTRARALRITFSRIIRSSGASSFTA